MFNFGGLINGFNPTEHAADHSENPDEPSLLTRLFTGTSNEEPDANAQPTLLLQDGPSSEELPNSFSDQLATRAEEVLIAQLREDLAQELESLPQWPDLVGELRLLRTLRAFRHDVSEAARGFRAHLKVRREFGIDAIREKILQDWGGSLEDLSLDGSADWDLVRKYLCQEAPYARTPQGDPVAYRLINVNDFENCSLLAQFSSTFISYWSEEILPLALTYNDFVSYGFFIRVPRWVLVPYNMMSSMVPSNVRSKGFILGDDFAQSTLLREKLGTEIVNVLACGSESAWKNRPGRKLSTNDHEPCKEEAAPATGSHHNRLAASPGMYVDRGLRLWRNVSCARCRRRQQGKEAWRVPPQRHVGEAPTGKRADRVYFALAVPRSGAECELQSWLHDSILDVLVKRQGLKEFRVMHEPGPLPRTSVESTVLVFELLVPEEWPTSEDWSVERWRRRLGQDAQLVGPYRGDHARGPDEAISHAVEALPRALTGEGSAGATPPRMCGPRRSTTHGTFELTPAHRLYGGTLNIVTWSLDS
eukprot:CAMPEP_0179224774 /NCGR_PEP_ID=MMETSP0797-20121207/7963_1 /TAXON_ID=47934 /ORGANISM="Dinophysis acuminata, Strain DAEP01" /LENGTH=532 /DNA_ID=CAMNT_0020931765 /DNA_START=79 /DNA_END=1673 /DNA_ORIENTATION=+